MKRRLACLAMAAASGAATTACAQETAAEREIRAGMIACGFAADRLTLERDAELKQDYVTVASGGSAPSDQQLECAAALTWRTRYMANFAEPVVAERFLSKLAAGDPADDSGIKATARQWLGEKGLLNKLPDFAALSNADQVAARLETFCNVKTGALQVDGSTITIDEATGQFEGDRARCVSSTAIASELGGRGIMIKFIVRP